nr:PD-(D/E)XK motif protein [Pseudotabrizicola formosa]
MSPPSSGLLHLAHVRLERAEGGSFTVAGLCRAILGHGADSLRLAERLGALGCTDPDAAEWNTPECELEGIDLYHVASGFPRITADQFVSGRFPEGVDGLKAGTGAGTLPRRLDRLATAVVSLGSPHAVLSGRILS